MDTHTRHHSSQADGSFSAIPTGSCKFKYTARSLAISVPAPLPQEPGGKTQRGVKFKLSSLSRPEISHLHMSAALDPDGANIHPRYVRHRGARARDDRVRHVSRWVRAAGERRVPRSLSVHRKMTFDSGLKSTNFRRSSRRRLYSRCRRACSSSPGQGVKLTPGEVCAGARWCWVMNELTPRGHLRPLGGRENPRRARPESRSPRRCANAWRR